MIVALTSSASFRTGVVKTFRCTTQIVQVTMRKLSISILAMLAVLVAGFFILGPGYKWKARSFFKQVQRTTTPSQIQKWALAEIERAGDQRTELDSTPSFLDMPDDGPPNYVWVEPNDGQPYLVAQWGGGFGHWGLLVGDDSLEYPIDDYFHIEWTPSVYVWHEIQ